MKKYLVFILTISILLLSACSTDTNNESSVETATSKIEVSSNADDKQEDIDESGKVDTKVESDTTEQESKVNTSEEDKTLQNTTSETTVSNKETVSEQQNTADTTSKTDTKTEEVKQEVQPQKTVITANAQTAKMSFLGYNSDIPQKNKNYVKNYAIDKVSAFEEYTKKDMQSKDFNIFGVEYKDIPYSKSEKNKYRAENRDEFENDTVEISVTAEGVIANFYPGKAINVFSDETKHSEELAKRYLDMIMPNYKYDKIRMTEIEVIDTYIYTFSKALKDVRTSDGVGIALNSKGWLVWYNIHDVGKYDNIEIENFNLEQFLQRIDAYVKEFYGDSVLEYGVQEDGPYFSIFENEKLELTVPIKLKIKDTDGEIYDTAEDVIFELN